MAKLEHPKNKRQSKFEKESVEFSAEVADVWSATMNDMDITSTTCDDAREMMLTKSSTSMTKIGTTAGTLWMWLQMRYSQQLCLKETRSLQ